MIALSDLEFMVREVEPNMTDEGKSETEQLKFEAFYDGVSAGQVLVDTKKISAGLYVRAEDTRRAGDIPDSKKGHLSYWFVEVNGIYVPRPRVWYQSVEEGFRGNGVAGRILLFANHFYKMRQGVPIHSSNGVGQEEAQRVWEKLTEEGFAYEYRRGRRTWGMN